MAFGRYWHHDDQESDPAQKAAFIDERFTNFGASGVILYALATGLLLAWMFRRTESRKRST